MLQVQEQIVEVVWLFVCGADRRCSDEIVEEFLGAQSAFSNAQWRRLRYPSIQLYTVAVHLDDSDELIPDWFMMVGVVFQRIVL